MNQPPNSPNLGSESAAQLPKSGGPFSPELGSKQAIRVKVLKPKTKSLAPCDVKEMHASRVPETFQPNADHRQLAAEVGVDLEWEHKKFMDYWRGASGQKGLKSDWNATFRNWLRGAAERKGNGYSKPAKSHYPVNASKPIDYAFTPGEAAIREGLLAKTAGGKL